MRKLVRNFTDNCSVCTRQNAVFLSILTVGLILRIFFIYYQGLSNDELSAWYRTRFDTWTTFWQWGVKAGDMHPFLYQFFLHFWLKIFGDSEWAIRSLSLVFYIANSFLIQRISEKFFTRQSGWLVNAFYATLTFMVINTTFSRPYNSGVFFLLFAFYALLKLMRNQEKSLRWMIFLGVSFTGAMLSHYFAFVVAFVMGFSSLLFLQGKQRLYILGAGLLSTMLFTPHLPVTIFQLNRGGLGWLAPPDMYWLFKFFWQWLNYSWLIVALFLFTLLVILLRTKMSDLSKEQKLGFTIFFSALITGYLLSYLVTPVLRELVMLYVLPFLLLPLFSIRSIVENERSQFFGIGLLVVIVGAHSVFIERLYQPIHFGVFKELGKEINAYKKKFGKQNIGFAINTNNVAYFNYYLDHPKRESIQDWFSSSTFDSLHMRLADGKKPYFCYVFNNAYDQPSFRELIRRYYPVQRAAFVTPGSAVFLFSKGNRLWLNPKRIAGNSNLKTSTDEFCADFKIKIKDLNELDPFDYYTFVLDLQLFTLEELYTVVCLTRNGEMVQKNSNPLYYQTINQCKVINDTLVSKITMPFQVPSDAQPDDEILFYLWNPKKVSFRHSEASLFEVK
jgi:hypothetical protein